MNGNTKPVLELTDVRERTKEESVAEETAKEQRAIALFTNFLREHRKELLHIAHWGDGQCGYMRDVLHVELFGTPIPTFQKKPRAYLSRSLVKQVFERDAYRCKHCGGFHDLTCDHILPESFGGETTLENLQTLCRRCNARKGKRHE